MPLGALINFSEIKIPISIENLLKILSSAALPLGLISIGYTLVLKEIKSAKKDFNCHYDCKVYSFTTYNLYFSNLFFTG